MFFATDINECQSIGKSSCGHGGTCVNLDPGWNCLCPEGYHNETLDGNNHECVGKYFCMSNKQNNETISLRLQMK